jgi:drug/metabolite transporter (DMT)-like permease
MHASSRPLRGIVLMIAAFAAFAVLDACAKYLTRSYGTVEIVFARYAISLAYVAGLLAWAGGIGSLRSRNLPLQVVRGGLLMAATLCNFVALQYLQLAQTSSIMFSSPLWVCALSVPLLGERVGPRRWLAVTVGFIGVLIIVRPGLAGFHWAMLLSIAAALMTALYLITTRKAAGYDPAETSLFYASLVGAVASAPFLPGHWILPDGWGFAVMLLCGLSGGVGHHMVIEAHRLAPAPTLAPFLYTQIVWMTLIGFLVFGDLPDRWTIAGAAVVVASGLYLLYRERRLGIKVVTDSSS